MAFTDDYSAFRAAISTWIDVSDMTITQVNDLIKVGEIKVNKKLRTRVMETALNVTINSSGQAAVPADFLEMKNIYISKSPVLPLERTSVKDIYTRYPNRSQTGQSGYYAREGSNFIFGNAGATNDVVKGIYYAKPTSMPGSSTINSVFTEHPDVYLFATLSEAEPFIGRDARIPIWEAKFQKALMDSNDQDEAEDQSGSNLATKLG